jgi:hypothetical protein
MGITFSKVWMSEWSTGSRFSEIVPLRKSALRERKYDKGAQGLKEEQVREKENKENGEVAE